MLNSISINSNLWTQSCLSTECTLHQIAPYIGKMKSTMARTLIENFSCPGDTVFDPFVGSGVVALECLIAKRGIISTDINPYAINLTKAKLNPPQTIEKAFNKADFYLDKVETLAKKTTLDEIPEWVKAFFHPQTLKELITITNLLRKNNEHFLLACILGILHHQRPGFLSYPASHLVPYLRTNKFPREKFAELYEYRDVSSRLKKKIDRVYRRFDKIDTKIQRECRFEDARDLSFIKHNSIDSIITSPPYMNTLDYARDNRLRLWFLGVSDYSSYDKKIPNNSQKFFDLMEACLINFKQVLRNKGRCILVIGEVKRSSSFIDTAQIIINLALNKVGGFICEEVIEDTIPDIRRSRRNTEGTKREWIIVLRKREKQNVKRKFA